MTQKVEWSIFKTTFQDYRMHYIEFASSSYLVWANDNGITFTSFLYGSDVTDFETFYKSGASVANGIDTESLGFTPMQTYHKYDDTPVEYSIDATADVIFKTYEDNIVGGYLKELIMITDSPNVTISIYIDSIEISRISPEDASYNMFYKYDSKDVVTPENIVAWDAGYNWRGLKLLFHNHPVNAKLEIKMRRSTQGSELVELVRVYRCYNREVV